MTATSISARMGAESEELFKVLGLNISIDINVFVKQVIS